MEVRLSLFQSFSVPTSPLITQLFPVRSVKAMQRIQQSIRFTFAPIGEWRFGGKLSY